MPLGAASNSLNLLPLPPECWDYRHEPPYLDKRLNFDEVQFINFLFCGFFCFVFWCQVCNLFNLTLEPSDWCSSVFSPNIFVLYFILIFMIHFKLLFVQDVMLSLKFNFFFLFTHGCPTVPLPFITKYS
jgi:hypothetical protein